METTMVKILAGSVTLDGNLDVPKNAKGIVLFAHGSGSSRTSSRNIFVAKKLGKAGFGTLLFDLLTPDEEKLDNITAELRFNISFLAERLEQATEFLKREPDMQEYNFGYFGASTGAAAALDASVKHKNRVKAIVCRGGRPDLSERSLARVIAPTLLIVGGNDTEVIELNQSALAQITAPKELAIVPGATHLFEEPGALEEVSRLAVNWFNTHLH